MGAADGAAAEPGASTASGQHWQRLGPGPAPGQTAHQQQRSCQIDLARSPWEPHCQRLRRVCVDQSTLIFHDDRYQPSGGGGEPQGLPRVEVDHSRLYLFPWRNGGDSASEDGELEGDASTDAPAGVQGAVAARRRRVAESSSSRHRVARRAAYEAQTASTGRRHFQPLPSRPASSLEPTNYLAHPVFSSCTVPVVVYPIHAHNFAHTFHDLGSFLHLLLRRTPWRRHAKVVVVTPDGLAMTPPQRQLLPALTNMSVQTWADFSRRLPPGYDPQADLQQPPSSFEGGERRCFENMYVCGKRFKAANQLRDPVGPSPDEQAAALAKAIPREDFNFGQEVVRQVQQGRQVQRGHAPGMQVGASSSGGGGRRPSSSSGGRGLKILFIRRGGRERQILNVDELLQRCNTWRHAPPNSTAPAVTAECRQVEMPDLEAGVAAAQEADVFVGVHGASMTNSWLMRPGSSTIEITPFQFGHMGGSFGMSNRNAMDNSSQLLWWHAVVCDAAISTPGPKEQAGTEPAHWWPRDRSVHLPWAALQTILEQVVALGGDRRRYMQEQFLPGRHHFNVGAAGVLSRGAGELCKPAASHADSGA